MITSIDIQGLRGIKQGHIDGLAPLTMFVGPNGCGKSTVLEAFGVACSGGSADKVFEALASREWLGLQGIGYWLQGGAKVAAEFAPPLSVGNSGTRAISIMLRANQLHTVLSFQGVNHQFACAIDADGRASKTIEPAALMMPFVLQNAFVDRPAGAKERLTGAHFSSAHRDALTTIKLSPWYDELFKYLQALRPKLTSIESIAVGDRDEPHLFEKEPRVGYPLAYAGDGFRRALLLAGTFARAKGGVAAIDEPEAYAHPGMFDALTGLIRTAVDDGTQVVAATHSLEFVAAALRAFEDAPEKAAVVGLRMEDGVLDPVVISGEDAHRRVIEFGHDLRL